MDGTAVRVYGRDVEFVRLYTFLDAIPRGPGALLLEGEAGVGKTTVWRWALGQAAAAEFRVLACGPAEAGAKISYAALGDLSEGIITAHLPHFPSPHRPHSPIL